MQSSIEENIKAIAKNNRIIGKVEAYQSIQDKINEHWDAEDLYYWIQMQCEDLLGVNDDVDGDYNG